MTTQEKIALAGTVITATGILVTIAIHRRRRKYQKCDDAVAAFRSLLQKLEHTHFFEIDPEQEIWEFGFDSIKELASLCARAVVAADGNFIPQKCALLCRNCTLK